MHLSCAELVGEVRQENDQTTFAVSSLQIAYGSQIARRLSRLRQGRQSLNEIVQLLHTRAWRHEGQRF